MSPLALRRGSLWPTAFAVGLAFILALISPRATADELASATISVVGISVDLDTRPDLSGLQYTMTAVKEIPTGVRTVVGVGTSAASSNVFPPGSVVKASIAGPGFNNEVVTVIGAPNATMALPVFRAAGNYTVFNIRLEDPLGNVILRRDPTLAPVEINVLDQLLVSQVTSRPMTLQEIRDLGVVIDQSNFTVLNFAVAFTVNSQQVSVNLPMLIPLQFGVPSGQAGARVNAIGTARLRQVLGIPNLSLSGLTLAVPPSEDVGDLHLPPVTGIIIIPGNIAFLNEFFNVLLQTSNQAPDGSGLIVTNAKAKITLPAGTDGVASSGDDPLRLAKTASGSNQPQVGLLDPSGSDSIAPQGTNSAQFIVEGVREGTHQLDFDITGDLLVPALGRTVPVSGKAAGIVEVENPTFNVVLAHPDIVREGEAYSIFATVTNKSNIPANLFTLSLYSRSISGAHLAPGETDRRTLETLAGGESQSFEFKLVADLTGRVTGTVFQADDGITGSFVFRTGVGDTGIPLSPDTLALPRTTRYLPRTPDLVFAAVRLLGQAYSVATAPDGKLPPGIERVSTDFVLERGSRLALEGVHVRFGESTLHMARDVVMDYFGNDLGRVATLYPPSSLDVGRTQHAIDDLRAFDIIRRKSDAGHNFTNVLAQILRDSSQVPLAQLQHDWAEDYASRPAHLSLAMSSTGAAMRVSATDSAGRIIGRAAGSDIVQREVPFFDVFDLSPSGSSGAQQLLFGASPDGGSYTFDFEATGVTTATLSLIVPAGTDMYSVQFAPLSLAAGARGRIAWNAGSTNPTLQLDDDGDGDFDREITAASSVAIVDPPPSIIAAQQWGKGEKPLVTFDSQAQFDVGDALGGLIGVLYDEEIEQLAEGTALVDGNTVTGASLQPDRRMVFFNLARPVGPFVSRALTTSGITDLRGHAAPTDTRSIVTDPELGDGAIVTGRVLRPNGTPVPFVQFQYLQTVRVCGLGDCVTRDVIISSFTTDASGRFDLDFVLQNDYGNFSLRAVEPERGDAAGAQATVRFNGQRMSINLVLRGSATLSGTVYDENGLPLTAAANPNEGIGTPTGVIVVATNRTTGEAFSSWVDAEGRYGFPARYVNPDNGQVIDASRVTVGTLVLQVVRLKDRSTAVTTVNVPSADSAVVQDLQLDAAGKFGRITGRVLEADGRTGAADVEVQVEARVPVGFSSNGERAFKQGVAGVTRTDAAGNFIFTAVPSGQVTLQAARASTGQLTLGNLFLGPSEQRTITMVLPGSGGTVRGVVRDALGNPVPFATVAAGPYLLTADAQGRFEIGGLPLGAVTVYGQGQESLALGTRNVTTTGPDDVQDIVITLEPIGSIQGTLFEVDRTTPSAGTKIQLWTQLRGRSDSGKIGEAVTDSAGHFVFRNFPVGDYSLIAIVREGEDGGAGATQIRFAGDERSVSVFLRGPGGRITGRVIQSNGTPALADVLVKHKVWKILRPGADKPHNEYLDFVQQIAGLSEELSSAVQQALAGPEVAGMSDEFFVLRDEVRAIRSDILGPGGEVTGEFTFFHPGAPGSFTVQAQSSFLAPAQKSGVLPSSANPAARDVDIGDLVLESLATGSVEGTVYLPDGKTPVGADVKVTIQSMGDDGKALVAPAIPIPSAPLPLFSVVTDENGRFFFPLTLRGRFTLRADTGEPDPSIRATSAATMRTDVFADSNGNRILNVRLFGQTYGSAPANARARADIALVGVAEVQVHVVNNDGTTPVPQARVTLQDTSQLNDEATQSTFNAQIADADGNISFFPVMAGDFSVLAEKPGATLPGRAAGVIPDQPPNGLVIEKTVKLGATISASGAEHTLAFTGTVRGIVRDHGGAPVTSPVIVTIVSGGVVSPTVTEEDGTFSVDFVPAGSFILMAREPLTARRGQMTGSIVTPDQVVEVDVRLNGIGSVGGQVFTSAGSPVATADVVLTSDDPLTGPVVSATDSNGAYLIPGVPTGGFSLTARDAVTDLTGAASGELLEEGELVTEDIYLAAGGSISGIVYAPGVGLNGTGQPVDSQGNVLTDPPVLAGAQVAVSGPLVQRVVNTDADGRFSSGPNLVLGQYGVRVVAAGALPVGAELITSLVYGGEDKFVPIAVSGLGRVEGVVLDSSGLAPANGVEVTLISASAFRTNDVTRITGADGAFAFDNVPQGGFTLSARTTLEAVELGAAVTDSLAAHGQIVRFLNDDADASRLALRLQDVGRIRGLVYLPNSTTPAQGTVIVVRGSSNGVRVAKLADASGTFVFSALPLDTYSVSLEGIDSRNVAKRTATVSSGGQVLDLGTIVLDGDSPRVVASDPVPDAVGARPELPIRLTFSEPLAASTVNPQNFTARAGSAPVAGTLQLSADGKIVTFTPLARFPDTTRVSLRVKGDEIDFDGQAVSQGVTDLQGKGMVGDYELKFVTTDGTPPAVTSFTPADAATNVALESVIRIEFDEPIDPASIGGFELRSSAGVVTGQFTSTPQQQGRLLVFVPAQPLHANTHYTATLHGPIRDLAGNAMAAAQITRAFDTLDAQPPTIILSVAPGSSLTQGTVAAFVVDTGSQTDIDHVEFYVNSTLTNAISVPPYTYALQLSPPLGTAFGLGAVAQDRSGNRSSFTQIIVPIAPNQAPQVTLVPSATTVNGGEDLTVTVNATDDVALSSLSFAAGDGAIARGAKAVSDRQATETFHFIVPHGLPGGTKVGLQAAAEDSLGQVTLSDRIEVSVSEVTPPTVDIITPVTGARLVPGTTVSVLVRATDDSGVRAMELSAPGIAFQAAQDVSPATSPAAAMFSVPIPASVSESTLVLTAVAEDTAGNRTTRQLSFALDDVQGPAVTVAPVDGNTTVQAGSTASLRVTASDRSGVRSITLDVAGAAPVTRQVEPAPEVSELFDVSIPASLPLGSTIDVTANATDTGGNLGTSPLLALRTGDLNAPLVAVIEPAEGDAVASAYTLHVVVRASDDDALATVGITLSGALADSRTVTVAAGTRDIDEAFDIDIPASATPGSALEIAAFAEDTSGNRRDAPLRTVTIGDGLPPAVAEVFPSDGAGNVASDTSVVVRFTEPLSPTSVVAGTVTLSIAGGAPVAGSVALSNDGLSVVFGPTLLQPATSYVVRVQGLRDLAGQVMAQPFASSFATVALTDTIPPALISTSVKDGATGVPVNAVLAADFSERLDPASLTSSRVILRDATSDTVVDAMVQIDALGTRVTLVPAQGLSLGRSYQLTLLGGGIADLAGNTLANTTTITFATGFTPDVAPPHVVALSPPDGATGVPINAKLVVQFDEPVDPTTVAANVSLTRGGQALPLSLALSDGNRRVDIWAGGYLDPNTAYLLSVGSGIRDVAGSAILAPRASQFQTGAEADTTAPFLVSSFPATGSTGVARNEPVDLTFSESLNAVLEPNAFALLDQSPGSRVEITVSLLADGRTVRITPSSGLLEAGRSYSVQATAADLAGNGYTLPTPVTFTTDPQFRVGGTVSGLSGSVTLRLNGGNEITVGGSGPFSFDATLPAGAAYNVAVASLPATQICAVTGGGGTIDGANVTNVAVACKDYSVGGTIAGLSASGLVLTVGGSDLAVAPGATFTFPPSMSLGSGASAAYRVRITGQPAGQTCTILRQLGTIQFAAPNVTNVAVTCVDNTTDVLAGTYRGIRIRSVFQPDTAVDGSSFITFYPDGTFIFATRSDNPDCGANDGNGLEYGAYQWNQSTGEMRFSTSLDTTSECGLRDESDVPLNTFSSPDVNSYTFTKNPDGTLSSVFDDFRDDSPFYITWAPVTSVAGTLIGSWGDNQFFDVFNADGTLFSATTFTNMTGIEDACFHVTSGTTSQGTYTPDFGAACTVNGSPPVDTNGVLGYSFYDGVTVPFTVNGDTLQNTVRPAPMQRLSATTYAVSGTITGLTGTGLELTLNGQRASDFVVRPAGGAASFKFAAGLPAGATFAVAAAAQPQNPSQICSVTSHGVGTVGSSDVTDVAVTCGPAAPYTVSGTITGLTANGLTLRLTSAGYQSFAAATADLGVASGATTFAFPGPVPAGGNFTVGIATQPTGQTCTVVRGRALISPVNVTNVGIACAANPASALIGTYAAIGPNGAADFSGYFNFNADATFTTALVHNDADCNDGSHNRNGNGIEYGAFNWSSSTGLMTLPVAPVIDTNDTCGFHSPNSGAGTVGYFTKVGNTLEARETQGGPVEATLTAVESVPGTIVGAFVPAAGNGRLLVFRADGTFLWADVQVNGLYPLGYGQERGCYTYAAANREITLSLAPDCRPDGVAAYDFNGPGELFPVNVKSLTLPLTVDDANTITFAGVVYKRNVPTFGVSGNVAGLSGSVTLRLNGGNDVTINASGPFNLGGVLRTGDPYTVSIASLPNTQVCGIANGAGTISGANVTNVTVTCASYRLGGTITSVGGPLGAGLVLQANGGNDLTVAAGSGSFIFPPTTSLPNPAAPATPFYTAHIKTQPAGQTCTIQNSTGIIFLGAPNVSSVAVTCVANVTDPLSGTYRATFDGATPLTERVYLTFYPDGTYIIGIHDYLDPGCAGDPNSIQYGVYRFTASTGELAFDLAYQPPNPCSGFDDDTPRGQFTVQGTLTKNSDGSLVVAEPGDDSFTMAPVPSIAGTLIGSWGDNQGFDVYGDDGTLFSANTRAFVGIPAVTPGIEDGCYLLSGTTAAGSYTVNFTGTCAVSGTQTAVDTSGPFGHSFGPDVPKSFTVTGDSLSFTGGAPISRITSGDSIIVAVNVPVTNAGFETGDLTGWPCGTSACPVALSHFPAHSGVYFADFGSQNSSISQAIPTTVGATYRVGFFLRTTPNILPVTNDFTVTFGTQQLTLTNLNPSTGYVEYSFLATASASSTTLTFHAVSVSQALFLDDVSVTQISLPFTVTLKPGSAYNANADLMDAALGTGGLTVEGFEDVFLIPGLSIQYTNPDASYTTLPRTFTDGSGASHDNRWDGTRVLQNHIDNVEYFSGGVFGLAHRVTFNVGSAHVFGIGLGNFQPKPPGNIDYALIVNGVTLVADVGSLPNFQAALDGNGRNGYLIVRAESGAVIQSVAIAQYSRGTQIPLTGNAADNLVFDHLAVGF